MAAKDHKSGRTTEKNRGGKPCHSDQTRYLGFIRHGVRIDGMNAGGHIGCDEETEGKGTQARPWNDGWRAAVRRKASQHRNKKHSVHCSECDPETCSPEEHSECNLTSRGEIERSREREGRSQVTSIARKEEM